MSRPSRVNTDFDKTRIFESSNRRSRSVVAAVITRGVVGKRVRVNFRFTRHFRYRGLRKRRPSSLPPTPREPMWNDTTSSYTRQRDLHAPRKCSVDRRLCDGSPRQKKTVRERLTVKLQRERFSRHGPPVRSPPVLFIIPVQPFRLN